MSLPDSYPNIKRSLVAFVTKYIPIYDDPPKEPEFPIILGTGFVVREDGLIAEDSGVRLVNSHAAAAAASARAIQPPPSTRSPA